MRLTIERMRTLVLGAGILLLAALVVFLVIGKWRNPFSLRDLPKRLGVEIQQESNGVTYTHEQNGRTLYKIHASKAVQLKQGDFKLHDVQIELYGTDGKRVDRIAGNEFDLNQKSGMVTAVGPVEITLVKPGEAPAIAPKATPEKALGKAKPLATVAKTASRGEIEIKTSGLSFDRNSGVATTAERVDFSLTEGAGHAMGAVYNSESGLLVLDHAVELNSWRGNQTVVVHAEHAEYERDAQLCRMRAATADFSKGKATAGDATIQFRDDGSAERLNAVHGFVLTTTSGSRLASTSGVLDFSAQNQPRHGHLEGGVTMDSASGKRQMHGISPTMELEFTAKGTLRHAHLERGVELTSNETGVAKPAGNKNGATVLVRVNRIWKSPVADMEFVQSPQGQTELQRMQGTEGVVVTSVSQQGSDAALPSRLAADELEGVFGAASTLTQMNGAGHAAMEQTAANGARQTTSGDRIEAHFVTTATSERAGDKARPQSTNEMGAVQIETATVDGHVALTNTSQARPGAPSESPLMATAGHAVYQGPGEWLHLTINPRMENDTMQISADRIDVSQASGDALAHGNVKATWVQDAPQTLSSSKGKAAPQGVGNGADGPAHAIAAEAVFNRATGEATFRGQARLWQQANSISAPVIVLDHTRQTLIAHADTATEPVKTVLVSTEATGKKDKNSTPSVIRMKGGDFRYSDAERKATMRAGAVGSVTAETGTATSVSSQVDLVLLPAGNHAGKDGASAQVDRMIAHGHVVLTSAGRRGTGEQLVYTGATGEYLLTGTGSVPPRMSDPQRGTVTGEALIFHSGDQSIVVEGGAGKTTTETTAPR